MSTRRLLLAALLFAVAACGAEAAQAPHNDLQVSPTGPSTVESLAEPTAAPVDTPATSAAGDTAVLPALAITSPDGRMSVWRDGAWSAPVSARLDVSDEWLITAISAGDLTTVSWIRVDDGTVESTVDVPGALDLMAIDVQAGAVALTAPTREGGTDVVIATRKGVAFRQSYAEELAPEAFANASVSADLPIGLFVIEYRGPAGSTPDAPRPYRVRVINLPDGSLGLPLNLRDKSQFVDTEMVGYGRSQIMSENDGLLFTLYRGIDVDDFHDAFVHTLGLVNGVWCLDLPAELALDQLAGTLALADRGARLLVGSANGLVTEFVIADVLDPEHDPLANRTVQAWVPSPGAMGIVMASEGDWVLAAQGTAVRWLDADDLTEQSAITASWPVEAAAVLPSGEVVVAGGSSVAVLGHDGETIAATPLPDGFGPVAAVDLLAGG